LKNILMSRMHVCSSDVMQIARTLHTRAMICSRQD
jgi:hypothetical protein